MLMKKINIVSKVRINGNLMLQEEIDPEVFRRLLEEKITDTMENVGFQRKKTA